MHKNVLKTIIALDKTVVFLMVKPLDRSSYPFRRGLVFQYDDVYGHWSFRRVFDLAFHSVPCHHAGAVRGAAKVALEHPDTWVSIVGLNETAAPLMTELLDVSSHSFGHCSPYLAGSLWRLKRYMIRPRVRS